LQRWKDSDLVRVNGVVLSVADAVTQLDMLWEREPLMQRLIDRCLIDEALERDPVEVSDAEIQRAFDAMRRGRRLLSTADLDAWMKDTGTSWQVLESMAMQLARVAKLRERTVGHRVDDALKGDLSRFDWVSLATVSAHRSEAIDAVREEARRGGLGLLHAAQCVFVQGGNERYETQLGRLRRHQLDDALQHAISEVTSGCNGNDENRVLGPLDTGERFMLAEVLALEAARPDDPELRRLVATQLFDDWLCDRRRHAKIEWFWGRA
jgi:putative peptide maturation system protein